MNLSAQAKRCIGKGLLTVGEAVPPAKSFLKKWGLRTKKEWFADRIVRVQLPARKSFKLASLSDNYLSFELFWRGAGYYEPITTRVAQQLARPGDTFIDVGANIGFYSLVVATTRPQIKVIAFEPNPKNYALLAENVRANQLTQITCEPVALSDSEGTALLYLSASDMSASLRNDFDLHLTDSVSVRTTTLDNYLAAHPVEGHCLIKVDVEGHEEAFFRGARQTLISLQPDIITEVALSYGDELTGLLRESGYRFYPITDQGLHESDRLMPVVRGQFVFLNYLLSARPAQEIAELFESIREHLKRIDLTQTSKFLDRASLQNFSARQNGGKPQPGPTLVDRPS